MNQEYCKGKYKELEDILTNTKSKNITILIHKNPDGDAMGSSLGLLNWLLNYNFNVKIISTNFFSEVYLWMPNVEHMLVFESVFKNTIIDHIKKSDVVFCLDFNQQERISNDIWNIITDIETKKICIIDHHPTVPNIKSHFSFIDPTATSTCEIIYKLLDCSEEYKIDANTATCLYMGMMTDTNKFTTPTVTASLHYLIGSLLEKHNIDIGKINKHIYGSNSIQRLRFLGYMLFSKLKILKGYKVAYVSLSLKEASKYHLNPGDTDGIVNYALSLKDVVVAVFFNQKKDGIYISLRSVGDFAVNTLAEELFAGGGHKNAAGGFSKESLKKTIDIFVKKIKIFDILKYDE